MWAAFSPRASAVNCVSCVSSLLIEDIGCKLRELCEQPSHQQLAARGYVQPSHREKRQRTTFIRRPGLHDDVVLDQTVSDDAHHRQQPYCAERGQEIHSFFNIYSSLSIPLFSIHFKQTVIRYPAQFRLSTRYRGRSTLCRHICCWARFCPLK